MDGILKNDNVDELAEVFQDGATELLRDAARYGAVNCFDFLMGEGADIYSVDGDGRTLLHYAAEGGSIQILNEVIDAGVKSTRDSKNLTAVHYACMGNSTDALKVLWNSGMSLTDDARTYTVQTCISPIHIAAQNGNMEMVEFLSQEYEDLSIVDNDLNNCLHYAARSNSPDVVQFFIDHGVDKGARNIFQQTPMDIALINRSEMVYSLLNESESFETAVRTNNIEYCREELENGCEPEYFGIAVEKHFFELCDLLIEFGADIDETDRAGMSALHYAAQRNDIDAVKYLVSKGASSFKSLSKRLPVQYTTDKEIKSLLPSS